MDNVSVQKLRELLKQLTPTAAKPTWFAFALGVGPKGGTPEPMLLLDRQAALLPGNVLAKARAAYKLPALELLNKKVYVGRITRGVTSFTLKVDAAKAPDAHNTEPIQRLLRSFAAKVNLPELVKCDVEVLSAEEQEPDEKEIPASQGVPAAPHAEEASEAADEAPSATPTAVQITRTKMAWTAVRTTASAEYDKLLRAIYSDPEVRADAEMRAQAASLKKTGWSLEAFDDALDGALDTLSAATDPDERDRALTTCRRIVKGYWDALHGDPMLARMDQNPFTPVKIHATLQKGLEAIDRALGVS